MTALPILYHDDRLVAVNKPAGLLVHRSFIAPRETEYAMQVLRDQLCRRVYPLHRLDKATSGVLLFALDKDMARLMTEIFMSGQVSKSYLAVVRGFTEEAGCIEHPLKQRKDKTDDPRADQNKQAQEAITGYRRLATIELPRAVGRYATARYSLIQAVPLTGRMHQIRRHMKHLFHPVMGDTTYGDGRQNGFFRKELNCGRLLLHGWELAFPHPSTGDKVRVRAPLDDEFNALLKRFGWDKEGLFSLP